MPNKKTGPGETSLKREGLKRLPSKKAKRNRAIAIDIQKEQKDYKFLVSTIKRDYKGRAETKMPVDLKPMLATIIQDPFNDSGWQFEIKWDGYRALVYNRNGSAEIRSRNNLSFNNRYQPITDAFQQWPVNAVIDGEVVVLSENGASDFGALQYWQQFQKGTLVFYAFDLLWLEGIDLTGEPLVKRRQILKKILPDKGIIRYSDDIDEFGIGLFQAARENGMEGIIAKRKDSTYVPGQRTHAWCKIKAEKKHEAVICGYTRKKDTDRLFSSLILGMYQEQQLVFIGQVGTGWGVQTQKELMRKMKSLVTNKVLFDDLPPANAEIFWLKPELVCEVKYTEMTKDGIMRHPSFQGIRIDKKAAEVQMSNDIVIPKQRNLKRNKWFRHQ